MCDYMKEKITEINDEVLAKLERLEEEQSATNALKQGKAEDITNLNFTPVNAETFGEWCKVYKQRMLEERIAKFGEADDKPTGK